NIASPSSRWPDRARHDLCRPLLRRPVTATARTALRDGMSSAVDSHAGGLEFLQLPLHVIAVQRIAGKIQIEIRGEALFLIRLDPFDQCTEITNLVALEEEKLQAPESLDGSEIRNLVVAQGQAREPWQMLQTVDGSELIVIEIQ